MNIIRAPRPRVQGTRWCFTLNNYTDDDVTNLRVFANGTKYLIFGREVGEEGTPHLQGFTILHHNHSLSGLKRLLGNRYHFETARSPSHTALAYCKKDGDFEAFGREPSSPQGTTNRYELFRDWVISHEGRPTMGDVANEFPSIALGSNRVQQFIDLLRNDDVFVPGEYRAAQQLLANRLAEPPCSRKIIFVVDPAGNTGKSWFVDYYAGTHDGVQILSIGRREDLAYAIDERKSIFFFDLPRSSGQLLQYIILEQLKDRRIPSNKYESRVKRLAVVPHVVVFMNEYPDMTLLSSDRYEIMYWS